MKPISLSLTSFQSYRGGPHAVPFPALAVLSGPNGAGKSSILDALCWALWGVSRAGADSVVTLGESAAAVEFVFESGGQQYRVLRKRSNKGSGSGSLSLSMQNGDGWKVLDGKTSGETQQKIISILGMTSDLFRATSYASQGQAALFAAAKPAERKAILGEILEIADWERYAGAARETVTTLQSDMKGLEKMLGEERFRASAAGALAEELTILTAERLLADAELQRDTEEITAKRVEKEQATVAKAQAEADERQRRDLLKRIGEMETQIEELTRRIAELGHLAEELPELRRGSERLEGGKAADEALQAQREQAAELAAEGKRLAGEIEAVKKAHAAEIASLEQVVSHQRSSETARKNALDAEAKNLNREMERLLSIAEPLGRVPCRGTQYEGECPLIAQAVKAQGELPALKERTLAAEKAFEECVEWTPTEEWERLEKLRVLGPAIVDMSRQLEEARTQHATLGYNREQHEALQADMRELAAALKRLPEAERADAQRTELMSTQAELRAQVRDLGEQVEAMHVEEQHSVGFWILRLKDLETEIGALERRIETQRQEIVLLNTKIARAQVALEAAEEAAAEVEKLEAELKAAEQRLVVLKVLVQGYSKNGVPALLIDLAIPDLQAEANQVLGLLSDGRMSLRLETLRENRDKSMAETLDIVIADQGGTREYEQFSGGERMRVDLALRLGLATLLARRAGARCELLVMDEACAPLDQAGQELFIEALEKISGRFASILVVTHIERLKERFPVCLQVTKNGDGSRVEVVS